MLAIENSVESGSDVISRETNSIMSWWISGGYHYFSFLLPWALDDAHIELWKNTTVILIAENFPIIWLTTGIKNCTVNSFSANKIVCPVWGRRNYFKVLWSETLSSIWIMFWIDGILLLADTLREPVPPDLRDAFDFLWKCFCWLLLNYYTELWSFNKNWKSVMHNN